MGVRALPGHPVLGGRARRPRPQARSRDDRQVGRPRSGRHPDRVSRALHRVHDRRPDPRRVRVPLRPAAPRAARTSSRSERRGRTGCRSDAHRLHAVVDELPRPPQGVGEPRRHVRRHADGSEDGDGALLADDRELRHRRTTCSSSTKLDAKRADELRTRLRATPGTRRAWRPSTTSRALVRDRHERPRRGRSVHGARRSRSLHARHRHGAEAAQRRPRRSRRSRSGSGRRAARHTSTPATTTRGSMRSRRRRPRSRSGASGSGTSTTGTSSRPRCR